MVYYQAPFAKMPYFQTPEPEKEKYMTSQESVEYQAREAARDARRDRSDNFRCTQMFLTDDVSKWNNDDYALYVKFFTKIAERCGYSNSELELPEGVFPWDDD